MIIFSKTILSQFTSDVTRRVSFFENSDRGEKDMEARRNTRERDLDETWN
jgi:hypothetical protein